MLRFQSIFAMMALTLAVFISSCEKEGPAGPAGPQGEPGAAGPAGAKGDKGATGNANVKVYTKDISNATWTKIGLSNDGYLKLDIPAPKVLTSDVVQNWINLVYVRTSDANGEWAQVPYYTERNIRVRAVILTGHLILERDQDHTPSTQSWFKEVKLICIAPSSTGPLARQAAPLPDLGDYDAVCAYYGIPK